MAYKLTRTSQFVLGLIALAALGSVAWNFYLKDKMEAWRGGGMPTKIATAQAAGMGTTAAPGATAPKQGQVPAAGVGTLGTPGNPLLVSIVSFHGYAPALVANGDSLETRAGSIFERLGVHVKFVINDDVPTLQTLFESKAAHCAWRTSDFWAQEQPNLRNAGLDGRAIVLVDNTQGGDAVIARDPAVRRIEDLAGRNVALLQYSPSHGMLIDALDNSSLTARDRKRVKTTFIRTEEGTPGVRAAFTGGHVDAAVLWDPDLSLALESVPGAHVVYSTKAASNLIFDVIVCNQAELAKPVNEPVFQRFVDGWMAGVDASKADPERAVTALTATEPLFTDLVQKKGKPFVKGLFSNLLWTNLTDNARILGLAGGTDHYSQVYSRFDQIYRAEGSLANPKSPVIAPQDSFDYRFIKAALQRNAQAQAAAATPVETFSDKGRVDAMSAGPAMVTKPVYVTFDSGSAALSKRAQQAIDKEMVPLIERNGKAYFELSGNTDSVGSQGSNMVLSQQRAKTVAEYLQREWKFQPSRFKVVGAGSTRPLCDEGNPSASELTLDECRALNRSTRIAVFSQ